MPGIVSVERPHRYHIKVFVAEAFDEEEVRQQVVRKIESFGEVDSKQ